MVINELIRIWAEAKHEASDNVTLMFKDPSLSTNDLCAQRMERLRIAEQLMMEYAQSCSDDEMPAQMKRYLQADENPACGPCWLSSRRLTQHPECQDKIKEYFAAEKALARYGNGLGNNQKALSPTT